MIFKRRFALAAGVAVLMVAGAIGFGSQAAADPPVSIFGDSVPAVAADSDSAKVELGVQFKSSVAGQVTGVRFFKGAQNTGTHTGSLWSGSTRVATGTFSGETASGWQSLTFAAPVSITAGTTYTASYLAPKGRYAVNNPYSFPKVNGSLTAVKGVYRYGGGRPTDVYQTSNYWVDVLFTPGVVVPPTTTPVSTTPTSSTPPVTTEPTTPPVTSDPTTPTSSTPPVTTTTTPPPSAGWPDASNTGVPAGTVLTNSGRLTVTQAGAVIDGLNIQGKLTIAANNVTVKRSKIVDGGYFIVEVQDGVTGFRIEDSEIDGKGTAGSGGSIGINGANYTVLRCNIHGVENGAVPEFNATIKDSWIHNLAAGGGDPHIDGIQIDGGQTNILIQGNTVDMREWSQTAAVMVDNWFGPVNGVSVDHNLLMGGGYTVYSDGQFNSSKITNVAFTNNSFVKGIWGYKTFVNNTPTWTGNVDYLTGKSIPAN